MEAKGTEFATAVARDRRPVVLTDTGAARWRAMGLWTPQYFCSASDAGGVEQVSVPVFQHTCVSLELQPHTHTHTHHAAPHTHHRTRTPHTHNRTRELTIKYFIAGRAHRGVLHETVFPPGQRAVLRQRPLQPVHTPPSPAAGCRGLGSPCVSCACVCRVSCVVCACAVIDGRWR